MSKTRSQKPFRVHAYGGGVQSHFLLCWYIEDWNVAEDGPSPYQHEYPDAVLFADTQAEPAAVYANVAVAKTMCERAGIRFEIVSAGNLADPPKATTGTQGIFVPLFTLALEDHWQTKRIKHRTGMLPNITLFANEPDTGDGDGDSAENVIKRWVRKGERGQLLRQCTERFKIAPLMNKAKQLAGERPIELWLGVSVDEAERMKKAGPNDRIQYAYPLIFDTPATPPINSSLPKRQAQEPKTRHDCITLLDHLGESVVKSACVFCPYRSDTSWAAMKTSDPVSWEAACAYDDKVRNLRPHYELFVHVSRTPLRTAYLQAADPNILSLDGLFAKIDMAQTGGCEQGYCGI